MVKLKIGSINCQGLASDKIKRHDIFMKCRQNYDITLLVDTHCKKQLEVYWRAEWGYEAKFSSYNTYSRGVAILFKNSFQFVVIKEISDDKGNFLKLNLKIHDYQFTLAVIYGPNNDDPAFFIQIQQIIESLGNSSVIISGDWNVPQQYEIDTVNYVHRNNEKSQKQIHRMMEELA